MAFSKVRLFLAVATVSALRVGSPRMCQQPKEAVTKGGLTWSQFDETADEQFEGRVVPTMQMNADSAASDAGTTESTLPSVAAEALSSLGLSDPTTLAKAEQDLVLGSSAAGFLLIFLLPLFDGFFADLGLSAVLGGGALGYAALRKDVVGEYARKVGGVSVAAADKVKALDTQYGVSEKITSKLPGGGGAGLSYADIKKFGISGTVAYILTELAFWAVAFPVASFTLYNTAGHWPDLSDGADRTAVLGFIFAGANVARLAVPLRFGVAFAAAPWCDENLVKPVQEKIAELKGGK